MANSWLRLWHDMPNDPKWRTIAKVSKQSISAVLAVYIHLLVIASNATERGRTQSVCSEDIASALDLDVEQIDAIFGAMQGRVLDGDMVSGWAKRQVEREDGSAERAKRWREAQKAGKQTQPNAAERKQTPDTDTDTDKKKEDKSSLRAKRLPTDFMPDLEFAKSEGIDGEREFEKFRDYWSAQGAKGAKSDWPATWRNWCRNAKKSPGATPMLKANTRPKWVLDAGFTNIHEANNEGCFERNAHEFQSGKRSEVAA